MFDWRIGEVVEKNFVQLTDKLNKSKTICAQPGSTCTVFSDCLVITAIFGYNGVEGKIEKDLVDQRLIEKFAFKQILCKIERDIYEISCDYAVEYGVASFTIPRT